MRTMSRISSSDFPWVGDAAAGWAAAGADCAAAGACAAGPCVHEARARDAARNEPNTVIWNKRFIVAPQWLVADYVPKLPWAINSSNALPAEPRIAFRPSSPAARLSAANARRRLTARAVPS